MMTCVIIIGKKRASKLSAIEMLGEKFEKKAELRKIELELKKRELELKEIQMDREHEERKKLEEERKSRMEYEFKERNAFLELIQKLSSTNSNK